MPKIVCPPCSKRTTIKNVGLKLLSLIVCPACHSLLQVAKERPLKAMGLEQEEEGHDQKTTTDTPSLADFSREISVRLSPFWQRRWNRCEPKQRRNPPRRLQRDRRAVVTSS